MPPGERVQAEPDLNLGKKSPWGLKNGLQIARSSGPGCYLGELKHRPGGWRLRDPQ